MGKYEQRGVSRDKRFLRALLRNNPLSEIVRFDKAEVTLHSDTAGTKPVLSYLYWKEFGNLSAWEKIVQDVLTMNLDDLAIRGFTDNFLVSFIISRNSFHIPDEILEVLIKTMRRKIRELQDAGIHIEFSGGETADVPDSVRLLDIGASVVSWRTSEEEHRGNKEIQAGDYIVGVASFHEKNSGIGTNGITNARHELLSSYYKKFRETYEPVSDRLAYTGKFRMTDKYEGRYLGDWLTDPAVSYLFLLRKILPAFGRYIRKTVHCTGGGQTKVLQKIHKPVPVKIIKNNLFPFPPFYRLLGEETSLDLREIFGTFNGGHRLEFYVERSVAEELLQAISEAGFSGRIIGECVESEGKTELEIYYQGHKLTYLWN